MATELLHIDSIERRILSPVIGAKFIILPGARLIYEN